MACCAIFRAPCATALCSLGGGSASPGSGGQLRGAATPKGEARRSGGSAGGRPGEPAITKSAKTTCTAVKVLV